MPAARLVRRRLLDPREASEAARHPLAGAVNIPFSELPQRTHELPPGHQELGVAGPAQLVRDVIGWLANHERRGVAAGAHSGQDEVDASEIGYLWEPNAFLSEVIQRLPGEVAVDLACGNGRDAVFMSSRGWDVTGVDLLPDAITRARDLAARCAPALRSIRWQGMDLETRLPGFDRMFDLITVFRYLHRPMFPLMREWLRPGGSLVSETFTTIHRERFGRPSRAAHVLQPNELPKLLEGFEIRNYSEAWRGRAHTARVWAVLV